MGLTASKLQLVPPTDCWLPEYGRIIAQFRAFSARKSRRRHKGRQLAFAQAESDAFARFALLFFPLV
jgi:hypothetical protein